MRKRVIAKKAEDTRAIIDFLDEHPGLAYAISSDGWKNVAREHVH